VNDGGWNIDYSKKLSVGEALENLFVACIACFLCTGITTYWIYVASWDLNTGLATSLFAVVGIGLTYTMMRLCIHFLYHLEIDWEAD